MLNETWYCIEYHNIGMEQRGTWVTVMMRFKTVENAKDHAVTYLGFASAVKYRIVKVTIEKEWGKSDEPN